MPPEALCRGFFTVFATALTPTPDGRREPCAPLFDDPELTVLYSTVQRMGSACKATDYGHTPALTTRPFLQVDADHFHHAHSRRTLPAALRELPPFRSRSRL